MSAAAGTVSGMRTWLTSPTAVLIGLIASVVTLLQVAVAAVRYVYRVTVDERSLIPARAALVALVAAVGVAPLEWPAIMAEAAKIGNGGVLGALYPVVFNGWAAAAALVLLLAAHEHRRLPVRYAVGGVAALAFAAGLYVRQPGAPAWGWGLVIAAPVVFAVAHLPLVLARRRLAAV